VISSSPALSRRTPAERLRADGGWSGFLDVGGQRLAVDARGQRPSLLLVNGVGGSRPLWEPLRRALPTVGTVAYDAPGCGRSAPATGPLSVPAQAALAAGVVRQLGLAEVDVLGFSFGGMIAQQLALDEPGMVRRLVLVGTGPGVGSLPGSPLAHALLAWPQLLSSPETVESLWPLLFGGGGSPEDQRRHRAAHWAQPVDPFSYLSQLQAGMGWSSLPWLTRIRQHTLVLAGDQDPLTPLINTVTMATLIRRAQLKIVPGGGHLMVVDRPGETATHLERFLSGTR
jgi:pimeloyl-ACP methyl ester carboxylesterase